MRLKAKKTAELIYIHHFATELQEGKVYTFFMLDDYSETLLDYVVTNDLSESSLLAVIVQLVENDKFKMYSHPFKLVVGFGQDITEKIQQIIKPQGGTVFFSQKAAQKRLYPVFKSFSEHSR